MSSDPVICYTAGCYVTCSKLHAALINTAVDDQVASGSNAYLGSPIHLESGKEDQSCDERTEQARLIARFGTMHIFEDMFTCILKEFLLSLTQTISNVVSIHDDGTYQIPHCNALEIGPSVVNVPVIQRQRVG